MRWLTLFLVVGLTACGSDDAAPAEIDDGVSVAGDVDAPDPVVDGMDDVSQAGAVATLDVDGDWFYCDGPSVLDTSAIFEDGQVSTYIEDRPGMVMPFSVEGDALVMDDGARYAATLTGDVLTLSTPADGDAVYARTAEACP